jgi:hypothetical protein
MRKLRSMLYWGRCPQTPGILPLYRQNRGVASQLGAAPPSPIRPAGGRRVPRLPAIPAAESALGLRPRRALSSAQVLPKWTTSTSPCQNFSSNGDYPLNFLSQSRGSLHLQGLLSPTPHTSCGLRYAPSGEPQQVAPESAACSRFGRTYGSNDQCRHQMLRNVVP